MEFVEAGNEFDDAGFACACVPHKGHTFAGGDAEAEFVQHLLLLGVAEGEVAEGDFAFDVGDLLVGGLFNGRFYVHQPKYPLAGG